MFALAGIGQVECFAVPANAAVERPGTGAARALFVERAVHGCRVAAGWPLDAEIVWHIQVSPTGGRGVECRGLAALDLAQMKAPVLIEIQRLAGVGQRCFGGLDVWRRP